MYASSRRNAFPYFFFFFIFSTMMMMVMKSSANGRPTEYYYNTITGGLCFTILLFFCFPSSSFSSGARAKEFYHI